VAICVRPSQLGSSSEFSSICGCDVVRFHHLFSRAARFLEEAATSFHCFSRTHLEFLGFESEDEKVGENEENFVKDSTMEATLESFVVNLSSHLAWERSETAAMLAAAASSSPNCRRQLSAVIMRTPMLSVLLGFQQLLRPESIAKETSCIKATRYPVLVLLVCLVEERFIEVELAQALHSMLAELDPCQCSTPVRAEFASAVDGLYCIVAGQD